VLEARNLTISYGENVVVHDVTLTLAAGSVTALIGPNGAGKSTLLRSMNGQIKYASGQVVLNGEPLEKLNRRTIARQITVVAQEAELRFPVTVMEFVLGGRFVWASHTGWGWESERDLSVANSVLHATELSQLRSRLMTELSGGERQRAVLARALATEAQILLLDEPTANLDMSHQSTLLSLVRQRCDDREAAALVVTHDINLAAQFADVVVLMRFGKAIQIGSPRDVLTPELLHEVFNVNVLVDAHPVSGVPRVTPVHVMSRPS
jgi:iron complex transport system ATP-binding protein